MNKFKKWIIRKLGGIPKDELYSIPLRTEISEFELIELQSRYIQCGVVPTSDEAEKEFIKSKLFQDIVRYIEIPIYVIPNKERCTITYTAKIKIPKEYIRSENNE